MICLIETKKKKNVLCVKWVFCHYWRNRKFCRFSTVDILKTICHFDFEICVKFINSTKNGDCDLKINLFHTLYPLV